MMDYSVKVNTYIKLNVMKLRHVSEGHIQILNGLEMNLLFFIH